METVLNVVVHTKVGFDKVGKVLDDFSLVLVQKSLQFGNIFEFIKVLFELCIKVNKDLVILVQNFEKLIRGDLIGNTCSLLKLTILLTESLVECWDLHFVVIHE